MYDGSSKPPISSAKLIIILLVAIILIMGATVALNGGTSAPEIEENTSNETELETENQTALDYKLIGNNSFGTVTKSSGYGNSSSDIHVAFILGVDSKLKSQNAIVPTLQSLNELNYCYDVYIVDALSSADNATSDYNNNLTANEKSESLAAEYVVPDIIKNNYNFTVDIHYTDDSNSYVYVPSENTYTSNKVVEKITNTTNVGRYTPDSHNYTEHMSEDIINYEIPSIVYVTRDYYNNGTSGEISSIIQAIDAFDFYGLFSSDLADNTTVSDANTTVSGGDSVTNGSSNSTVDEKVVTVSSNSSGNKEVN